MASAALPWAAHRPSLRIPSPIPLLPFTMRHTLLLTVTASFFLSAAPANSPCLPEGEIRDLTFTTHLSTPGIPADAEIILGSGEAWEHDHWLDDPMGVPTETPLPGGGMTYTVPVRNDGGDLSGPNGEVQNGVLEGDCIEVKVSFKIRYSVKVCVTVETGVDAGGVNGSTTREECWTEIRDQTFVFKERTVCPCP